MYTDSRVKRSSDAVFPILVVITMLHGTNPSEPPEIFAKHHKQAE